MGIGGRDYSHRSVQRSSLRELSEGGGEPAENPLPASPRPPGGLSHPRWSRSLASRRRREPTRPEQHHLPAEQTPEHRRIARARKGGRSDFTSFQASPRAIGVGTPKRTIPDRFVKPYRRHEENSHLRRNRQNTAWVIGSVGTTNATGLSMP